MRYKRSFLPVMAIALGLAGGSASAGDLTFQFINPSFGGNPGNSGHLLSIANAQREATASDADDGDGVLGTGDDTGDDARDSRADLFVRQLEGRLLSALSAEVTDAIFGEDPQDQGTVEFGDTTITFERTPEAITLDIIDLLDGTSTTISVPQLVTSGG
ncbi:MAG: curli assembly protein CsgF [Roseovarius sp.]|nr:curli assembly protein CsgF [Roseovarius sp.]